MSLVNEFHCFEAETTCSFCLRNHGWLTCGMNPCGYTHACTCFQCWCD